jgi:hypothetical protein
MATAGMATVLKVTPKQLIRALGNLHPSVSALVVGFHGIGKSQIVQGVAEMLKEKYPEHEWPVFDRRLAQMTEGDLIGIPDAATIEEGRSAGKPVTSFLPTDWWQQSCDAPAVINLDELNRAETQLMNGGFQIVGARELNGRVLHQETRVIACINPPAFYQVQEMDKALLDRFIIFWLKHDVNDWLDWARGRLDDALVDFIKDQPGWLHHDVSATTDLEVAPTPRSWEKLDIVLKHAGIPASDCMGRAAPDLLTLYSNGLVGRGASNALLKWLRDRAMFLKVEDVLDNWQKPATQQLAKRLRHEEILSCIDRIGQHSEENTWSAEQASNLVDFAMSALSGEDQVQLFSKITKSKNITNVMSIHNTPLTTAVVKATKAAKAVGDGR